MSNKLDALGWTKVFVDSRHYSPMITLPKIYKPHSRTLWDDFVKKKSKTNLKPFDPISASTVPTTTNPRRAKSLMSGEYNHLVRDDSEQGKEEESIKVTQTFGPRIKEYDAIIESKEILKFMSKNDRFKCQWDII